MWTPPVLSTGRLGAEDRCVLFASVRLCPLLLPAIATGFGQKMPILGRKMVDSRSDSWRRGRDSNPGTFQSAVFKSGSGRSRGFVDGRFTRESGVYPSLESAGYRLCYYRLLLPVGGLHRTCGGSKSATGGNSIAEPA